MSTPSNKSDDRTLLRGIDISHHQGEIDWQSVRAAGVEFAFIKATEGTTFVDPRFKTNWKQAKEAGLIRGAYHFFRTTSPLEGNIANIIQTVGELEPGDLPIALDLEVPNQWTDLAMIKRTELILRWTEGVSKHFTSMSKPILYLSPNFANEILSNQAVLGSHRLWLAHYTTASQPRVPQPWSDWTFWQHTDKGNIPGIKGHVDLDLFAGTGEELSELLIS